MTDEILYISLNEIEIVSNTRSEFDENALKELALSIKTNGVIQPVVVKLNGNGKYRLICGERRYRASLMARKPDIPARVVDVPDNKILQFQIVENLQRKGISPMDEIRAIASLRDEEAMTQEEIAKAIGKHPSHVAAQLLISRAIPAVHEALEKNQIFRQVALLIANLDSTEKQVQAVNALKRENIAFRVKSPEAKKWIENSFGVQAKRERGRFTCQPKNRTGRFAADWKYYLVRFSTEQFEQFKEVCRGRTETQVLAEAVEEIMIEASTASA